MTFIRRVTVDLCGRLPTPDETHAYVADLTALPVALGLLPVLTAFVAVGTRFAPALQRGTTVLSGASNPLRPTTQTASDGARRMGR